MKAILSRPAVAGLWSLAMGVVQCQTPTSSPAADGLNSNAVSTPAQTNTVVINGMTTTFRAIPTLPASIDETPTYVPNIEDPQAVDPQTVCPGYTASNVQYHALGLTASLALAGQPCNVYGTDVDFLTLTVQYQSEDRLSVKISPTYIDSTNATQYLIDPAYVYQPTRDSDAKTAASENDLQFVWSNEPTFGFSIFRKSTGDVLYNTTSTVLVYEDQFVEWMTAMPENYNIYGLGEHIHSLRLGNNFTSTLWATDAGDPVDANIYGSHPFYLDTRYYEIDADTGELTLVTNTTNTDPSADYTSYSHGVFLRNAHGQEILMRPDGITWRTLGGEIDLYFFDGPSAPEVTQQYQAGALGGYPVMQQYWTFGYHQCRWGYTNWTEMFDLIENFRRFNIPVETVWNDIDYMHQYRDYENDPLRFGYEQGKEFLDMLHSNGQHYVPIVDSAIYIPNPNNASDAYDIYTRGHAMNAFMTNEDGSEYIGAVWPGFTVFPDWRSPQTGDWWTGEMTTWHEKLNFDGIWIDMSEASSFCVGSCGSGRLAENPVHPPFGLPGEPGYIIYDYPEGFAQTNASEAKAAASASSAQVASASATATSAPATTARSIVTPGVRQVDYPPYVLDSYNGALPVHGLAPNATHADGSEDYDIHNLWGYEILNATYNALSAVFPGKRPFIIGRSTFAGAGRVAGHWGGDNTSKWYYMYFSIPQALSFSLFGIPMFGVDTCGFNGNSDEELCNRWMQLSAFFPFYRNHNTLSANAQEPYVWSSVIDATKTAINIRYSMLPYMYTLFYLSHTTGSTVMRALSWEFPNDPSLAAADRQFLLGPSILVTPVLTPNAVTVSGVFPGSGGGPNGGTVWYDWYTGAAETVSAGENKTLSAPLSHIPVHVRGGSVLPLQEPGYTTTESRRNPWALLVALDLQGSASGSLYLDDGESVAPNATRYLDFLATGGDTLYVTGRGRFVDSNPLANITIWGVQHEPSVVMFNGQQAGQVSYDSSTKAASITGLESVTATGAWNEDWQLIWW